MKQKIFLFLSSLLGILLIYSCGLLLHPDTFRLDINTPAPIEVFILSDISLVEKTCDNEVLIHKNGACSIKRPDLTTSSFEFTVTLNDGDGIRVMMRTDRKKYKKDPGIVFEYTRDGSVIYENGKEITRTDSIKATTNFPVKISFINEGNFYQITADCDTVCKGTTLLPETEYFIIESMNTDCKLSGISMNQLYNFEREKILEVQENPERIREEKIIIK